MKKSLLLAAGVALAATTACSDTPTAVAPDQTSSGVSAPGTDVGTTFTIVTPGNTVVSYRTTPKSARGTCAPGGQFFNQAGNNQGFNHTQCTEITVTPGSTVVVTFAVLANFVQPKSGNINLNFSICGYTEDAVTQEWVAMPCEASTYVHYKKNGDWTEGAGVITGHGDDGSTWTIDLGQIGMTGNAGLVARSLGPLVAQKDGGGSYGAAFLNW
ncbi:MAG TPA: hypothetical protein VHG93_01550 [Longimicrobium sp.]|nr:hypothetical protein [Longimicrobium sp.]